MMQCIAANFKTKREWKDAVISESLEPATLIKRYKRFLADVELPSGEKITIHCPNPGSMFGIADTGTRIWLRPAKPGRKLSHGWVVTELAGAYVCVDTLMANRLLYSGLTAGKLDDILPYNQIAREKTFGDSRFDFFLTGPRGHLDGTTHPECFMEVKSTTLAIEGSAMFPDAVTERGRRHLRGLVEASRQGYRAVQFFCLARHDVSEFRPADHIDVEYGQALRMASENNVDIFAWTTNITSENNIFTFAIGKQVPVLLG